MGSERSDQPADRSPEELAAVLADLAAQSPGPVWQPVGERPPEIWSAPAANEDPLSRLHRDVAQVEAAAPSPSKVVPPAAPPLERVGNVPHAWSTLRADRRAAGVQSARAKRLAGVVAAARKLGRPKD